MASLANVTSQEIDQVVVAYEPVWAIGTGENAHPHDVTQAVAVIRRTLKHMYGDKAARSVQVVYGGSVTSHSAADYLAIQGIDGLLIGGASLDLHEFSEIIKKAHNAKE